jgi:hypothetical protein
VVDLVSMAIGAVAAVVVMVVVFYATRNRDPW